MNPKTAVFQFSALKASVSLTRACRNGVAKQASPDTLWPGLNPCSA
jgi:hypothetical protein